MKDETIRLPATADDELTPRSEGLMLVTNDGDPSKYADDTPGDDGPLNRCVLWVRLGIVHQRHRYDRTVFLMQVDQVKLLFWVNARKNRYINDAFFLFIIHRPLL